MTVDAKDKRAGFILDSWVLIRPIVDGLGESPEVVEAVMDDLENPLPVHLIVRVDREIAETHRLAESCPHAFRNYGLRAE
jgi:hypothetical protein